MIVNGFWQATPDLAQLRELRAAMPAWWDPIFEAVEHHGVGLVSVEQDIGPFGLLPAAAEPYVAVISDDPMAPPGEDPPVSRAKGPAAFDTASLVGLFKRARSVIVLAAEAKIEYYAAAATVAVLLRKNAVIVETQPEHEAAWQQMAVDAGITSMLVVTSNVPPGTRLVTPLRPTPKDTLQ